MNTHIPYPRKRKPIDIWRVLREVGVNGMICIRRLLKLDGNAHRATGKQGALKPEQNAGNRGNFEYLTPTRLTSVGIRQQSSKMVEQRNLAEPACTFIQKGIATQQDRHVASDEPETEWRRLTRFTAPDANHPALTTLRDTLGGGLFIYGLIALVYVVAGMLE